MTTPAYFPQRPDRASLRWLPFWLSIGLAAVVLLVWGSVVPHPPELGLDPSNWTGHGLAYALLMAWFARLVPPEAQRGAAIALIGLGVAIECVQGLLPWRTFDVLDMVANAVGVWIGWAASPPRVANGLPALERLILGE